MCCKSSGGKKEVCEEPLTTQESVYLSSFIFVAVPLLVFFFCGYFFISLSDLCGL